jgi:hypothetical protein
LYVVLASAEGEEDDTRKPAAIRLLLVWHHPRRLAKREGILNLFE